MAKRADAMTTHYLDITVVPDLEASGPQIIGVLYGNLHEMLVQKRVSNIGVSFPRYNLRPRAIGDVLRVHGRREDLVQLVVQDWLKGVRDHVRMTDVRPVPFGVKHRTVSRKQFKTNAERLRRRRMRRKGETVDQAKQAIPSTVERVPNLPYVHLKSRSTGQNFRLYIRLGPLQDTPREGTFNSYGLDGAATIPWF